MSRSIGMALAAAALSGFLGAALGGCALLLPAKMLCYPEPLAGCLARHQPPAAPPEIDREKR